MDNVVGPVTTHEFRGDINVALGEDFKNDDANGTRLWEAGMLLSRYVEVNCADKMRGKRVLELGAGTGLLGIYLAALKADVLMTDNNELVLKLLRQNAKLNKSRAQVKRLDWSDEIATQEYSQHKPYDFIMGADCVFSLDATRSLVNFLSALMRGRDTVGFMSIETRDDAVTRAFEEGMRALQFDVVEVSQKGIDGEYRHPDIHIFRFVSAAK